jgi:hypothetical protein
MVMGAQQDGYVLRTQHHSAQHQTHAQTSLAAHTQMHAQQSRGFSTVYVPVTVADSRNNPSHELLHASTNSYLPSLHEAAHMLNAQHVGQQRPAMSAGGHRVWMHAHAGGHASDSQASLGLHHQQQQQQQQMAKEHLHAQKQQHQQQQQQLLQHGGAGAKRSFDTIEKSGLQPNPEPPQVRTIFMCKKKIRHR